MMRVRRLGFFSEFGGPAMTGESMTEAVSGEQWPGEADVVRYLGSGVPVLDVMEMSRDVLDGSRVGATGSLLTDGSWYWREDLAHYVSKYHLRLPAEFIDHAARRAYTVPVMTSDELARVAQAVISDWQHS